MLLTYKSLENIIRYIDEIKKKGISGTKKSTTKDSKLWTNSSFPNKIKIVNKWKNITLHNENYKNLFHLINLIQL